MMDFLIKLQQYRQLTRIKNESLEQLHVEKLKQDRLVVSHHFEVVKPIWEKYGFCRGIYPDGRSKNGKACQEECLAEDLKYYAKDEELRLSYTVDRKRVIDEYNKAVIELGKEIKS